MNKLQDTHQLAIWLMVLNQQLLIDFASKWQNKAFYRFSLHSRGNVNVKFISKQPTIVYTKYQQTIVGCAIVIILTTQIADKTSSLINKFHKRIYVSLAAWATDRTTLSKINNLHKHWIFGQKIYLEVITTTYTNILEIAEREIHKLHTIIYICYYSYTRNYLNTVFMGSTPTADLISSSINREQNLKDVHF